MIRRISKNNDYRDIIKSCPSGVIDDIYSVKYFISGHPEVEVEANFTKKGNLLEVILPTSLLEELGNGVLMRRALYSDVDPAFPDGEYNLEFIDDLNVWLGDEEVDPIYEEYVTEDELESTLGSYATQDWVGDQGFLTAETLPSDIATQSWVESQGFFVEDPNDPVVTQSDQVMKYDKSDWIDIVTSELGPISFIERPVEESDWGGGVNKAVTERLVLGYKRLYDRGTNENDLCTIEVGPDDAGGITLYKCYITAGYDGDNNGESKEPFITFSSLSSYATQSWVQSQGYLTMSSIPSNLATRSWVENQGYLSASDMSGYATESWVSSNFITIHQYESLNQYIGSVQNELYSLSEYVESAFTSMGYDGVNPFATESYVSSYVESYLDNGGYAAEDPDNPFATEGWVQEQGYLTDVPSEYATKSWVESTIGSISLPADCVQYDQEHPLIEDFGYNVDVLKRSTFDHTSGGHLTDRITKGLVLAYEETYSNDVITDVDTIEIRDGLLASVHYDFDELNGEPDYHEHRNYFATESWVQSQGYITSTGMSGLATQSWVESQGYLTSVPSEYATKSFVTSTLSDYATQSWVQSQGYLTEVPSGYATTSWVQSFYGTRSWTSNNFVSQGAIWTGTQSQWNQLTSAEKASYTIALITQ